jgi:3-dehydroquinate dehydratase
MSDMTKLTKLLSFLLLFAICQKVESRQKSKIEVKVDLLKQNSSILNLNKEISKFSSIKSIIFNRKYEHTAIIRKGFLSS